MARDDYAIVMGVQGYPTLGGRSPPVAGDLLGPVNDVDAILAWLKSAQGGDVPDVQVRTVTTAGFPPGADPRPVERDMREAFDWLKDAAFALSDRPRRLYVYASGHGFARRRLEGGIYLADAAPESYSHLAVSDYFNWFVDAGVFRECVLVLDACMDQGRLAQVTPPHLSRAIDPEAERSTRVFAAYSARFAGRSVENAMPNGKVHGAFTYALRLALEGAASVPAPGGGRQITTASLRNYLIATTQKLMRPDQREDTGVSIEPDFGPLDDFVVVEDAPLLRLAVELTVPPAATGRTFTLQDAAFREVARFRPAGGRIDATLSPGFYVVTSETGWRAAFEITGFERHVMLAEA